MLRRIGRWLLPWAVEAIMVVALIVLYQLIKLKVTSAPEVAMAHGRDVIALERAGGVLVEPGLERWVLEHTGIMPLLRWLYLNLHFPVTLAFLLWLRTFHRERYPRIRNGFAIAHAIALLVFVLYPCAPPRMFPEIGLSEVLHLPYEATHNPYAAIPSMHYGYATLVGGGLVWLGERPWLKVLGALYLVLVFFVIVATAAHWFIDAPLGALTIGLGLIGAGAFRAQAEVRLATA